MGVQINQCPQRIKVKRERATFATGIESKLFIIENERGDKIPIRYVQMTVEVTTAYGDTVTFTKSNRSRNFGDSREKKAISEQEVKSELARLLDTKEDAEAAFQVLDSEGL
jgi:hypothetical protein